MGNYETSIAHKRECHSASEYFVECNDIAALNQLFADSNSCNPNLY